MAETKLTIDSQNLALDFGGGAGVFDLTYQVAPGTILGMIGPSGCGKTTTVRLALGLYTPTSGIITVFDKSPNHFTSRDREQIGYIPQQFVLYPNLTVTENAAFVASLYGMPGRKRRERLAKLLEFVDLHEARNRLGSQLSGGMQRRLMLVGALMHDPVLLFADEPTAGIDPVLRGRFWDYFRQLRDEGRTLFITTQVVSEAIYCDYVAVMRKGRLLAVDTPAGLKRRALGGEIVSICVDPDLVSQALHVLQKHPSVKHVQRAPKTDNEIHVTVEDASRELPGLLNLLEDSDGPAMTITGASELEIPYDEIFIRIMEQAETTQENANA